MLLLDMEFGKYMEFDKIIHWEFFILNCKMVEGSRFLFRLPHLCHYLFPDGNISMNDIPSLLTYPVS